MSSSNKNILVTGGAGFMGSHVCDALLENEGVNVICVDNYLTGSERNIDHLLADPRFVFVRHDIALPLDLESVPELSRFHISLHGVHEVYHLACPTSPQARMAYPLETLNTCSTGTQNILAIAIKWRAKFLYVSASAIYGSLEEVHGIREDAQGRVDHLGPRAPYEVGKRYGETLTWFTQAEHPFQPRSIEAGAHFSDAEAAVSGEAMRNDSLRWAAIARVFTTYGPRMKLNDGRIIPDLVGAAFAGHPLVIPSDESWQTSLCYVGDMVNGLIRCMDVLPEKPVNLGSPHPVAVKEVAERILKLTESKSKIEFNPEVSYVTPTFVPDISRAQEELGWFPVISLEDGLKETIEAMKASQTIKEFRA